MAVFNPFVWLAAISAWIVVLAPTYFVLRLAGVL